MLHGAHVFTSLTQCSHTWNEIWTKSPRSLPRSLPIPPKLWLLKLIIEGQVLVVTRSLWVPLDHSVTVTILNSENLILGPRGVHPPIPLNSVSTQNLLYPPIIIATLDVERLYLWFHVPDSLLGLIPQVPSWTTSVRTLVSFQPLVSLDDNWKRWVHSRVVKPKLVLCRQSGVKVPAWPFICYQLLYHCLGFLHCKIHIKPGCAAYSYETDLMNYTYKVLGPVSGTLWVLSVRYYLYNWHTWAWHRRRHPGGRESVTWSVAQIVSWWGEVTSPPQAIGDLQGSSKRYLSSIPHSVFGGKKP